MEEVVKENVKFTSRYGTNYTGTLVKSTYLSNGRTALALQSETECITIVTVNITDEHLEPDEIFIKDYSENEGILEQFIEQGIVSKPIGRILRGFVSIPKVKLLV